MRISERLQFERHIGGIGQQANLHAQRRLAAIHQAVDAGRA
jgi:hypothetical protein